METQEKKLSVSRLTRLRAQGYLHESDQQLSAMAFGVRFAYRACVTILIVAMITKSIAIFSFMLGIAFLGVVLPNHPFDYIYNHIFSNRMNKPKLPARSPQLKFACSIASVWLVSVIFLMWKNYTMVALIMAGVLAFVAALPSIIDLCIPSVIYNTIYRNKTYPQLKNQ